MCIQTGSPVAGFLCHGLPAIKHGDLVSAGGQLQRGGQSGHAGTNDSDSH